MIPASEAFDKTLRRHLETGATRRAGLLFEEVNLEIEGAITRGEFATKLGPYSLADAEALAILLEQYGYSAHTHNGGESDGETVCQVIVSWRYLPIESRKAKVF